MADELTEGALQLAPPPDNASSKIVRLSINLAPSVAAALKGLTLAQGITITEGIRRAIALWKLVEDERRKGNRVYVVEGDGENAKYREVVLL